jgi:hypothetical protein
MVGAQFGVRRCPYRTHHRFARLPPLSCPGGLFTLTSFAGGALVGDARLAAVCRLRPPWWTIPAVLPRVSRASLFCRLGTPAAPIHSSVRRASRHRNRGSRGAQACQSREDRTPTVTRRVYADLFDADLDAVALALDGSALRERQPSLDEPQNRPSCVNRRAAMAVAEGFEPSDGGYPSHAFEACSLGRSDTPPCGTLQPDDRAKPIADQAFC